MPYLRDLQWFDGVSFFVVNQFNNVIHEFFPTKCDINLMRSVKPIAGMGTTLELNIDAKFMYDCEGKKRCARSCNFSWSDKIHTSLKDAREALLEYRQGIIRIYEDQVKSARQLTRLLKKADWKNVKE